MENECKKNDGGDLESDNQNGGYIVQNERRRVPVPKAVLDELRSFHPYLVNRHADLMRLKSLSSLDLDSEILDVEYYLNVICNSYTDRFHHEEGQVNRFISKLNEMVCNHPHEPRTKPQPEVTTTNTRPEQTKSIWDVALEQQGYCQFRKPRSKPKRKVTKMAVEQTKSIWEVALEEEQDRWLWRQPIEEQIKKSVEKDEGWCRLSEIYSRRYCEPVPAPTAAHEEVVELNYPDLLKEITMMKAKECFVKNRPLKRKRNFLVQQHNKSSVLEMLHDNYDNNSKSLHQEPVDHNEHASQSQEQEVDSKPAKPQNDSRTCSVSTKNKKMKQRRNRSTAKKPVPSRSKSQDLKKQLQVGGVYKLGKRQKVFVEMELPHKLDNPPQPIPEQCSSPKKKLRNPKALLSEMHKLVMDLQGTTNETQMQALKQYLDGRSDKKRNSEKRSAELKHAEDAA